MNLSLFKPAVWVGIDIQLHEIRLVQLIKNKPKPVIENFGIAPLAMGKAADWEQWMLALTTMVDKLGLKGLPAAVSLPSHLTRLQKIALPKELNDQEIITEIKMQMARDLAGSTEALCVDFVKTPGPKPGYDDIYFVAAKEEMILQYSYCIRQAGLKLKIIDIHWYALTRILSLGLPVLGKGMYGIFYWMKESATFIIFNALRILYSHQWQVHSHTDWLEEFHAKVQMGMTTIAGSVLHGCVISGETACLDRMIEHRPAVLLQVYPFNLDHYISSHAVLDEASKQGALAAIGAAMRDNVPC